MRVLLRLLKKSTPECIFVGIVLAFYIFIICFLLRRIYRFRVDTSIVNNIFILILIAYSPSPELPQTIESAMLIS